MGRMTKGQNTRDPTTQQQGWRFGLVSPWRLDHTRVLWNVPAEHPQYTGAHHDGKAVDGPKPPQLTRKLLRTPTW